MLVAAGEFLRRTGYRLPLEGFESASLPGILTAAGAFTLFGAIYAAHGIYGFLGPSAAFALLGLVALGTIAAALVHGRLLAGLGLLGSYATPVLVASTAPNPWALFGFLAVVLAASAVIAARRAWRGLMTAAIAGIGLWCLAYLADADPPALAPIAFAAAAVLAALAVVWLGNRRAVDATAPAGMDWPSAAAGLAVGLVALAIALDPDLAAAGGAWLSLLLVAAMLAAALWRGPALPLLHAAGAVVVLIHLRMALSADVSLALWHGTLGDRGPAADAGRAARLAARPGSRAALPRRGTMAGAPSRRRGAAAGRRLGGLGGAGAPAGGRGAVDRLRRSRPRPRLCRAHAPAGGRACRRRRMGRRRRSAAAHRRPRGLARLWQALPRPGPWP